MTLFQAPTSQMREGRRYIESLSAVKLLEDFKWFESIGRWGILIRIQRSAGNPEVIPSETDWWVLMDKSYPFGKISIWPSVDNGLTLTFPHQRYNGKIVSGLPWRSGEICVRSPSFIFGKQSLDPDPVGQSIRLLWYLQRSIHWLETAAAGNLLANGDPFELPDFPANTSPQYTVAHAETPETYGIWTSGNYLYGTAEGAKVDSSYGYTLVLQRFFNEYGDEVLAYPWGCALTESKKHGFLAVWIRSENLPVDFPYQSINSWGGLFDYLQNEGQAGLIRSISDLIRDGESHLLLFGFPIPNYIGQPARQLHWQPILLPVLSHGTIYRNGFRSNEQGYWLQDKYDHFAKNKKLDWQSAENWSKESSAGKGRIECLSDIRSLVIGAGAVGSVVSEILVRAGVGSMVICDSDIVEHGNLCRHTLQIKDIKRNKAEAVADRLLGVHAHAVVKALADDFPPVKTEGLAAVKDCDLILDCTGDDALLHELARLDWDAEKIFCSISLSYKAARIYIYTARGQKFPVDDFRSRFAEWAERDAQDFNGEELIQGDAGCWHPSFPARVDEVWMLSSAAIRILEETVETPEGEPRLVVFEQFLSKDGFQGIRRV